MSNKKEIKKLKDLEINFSFERGKYEGHEMLMA